MAINVSASQFTPYSTRFNLQVSAALALLTAVVGLGLALFVAPRMEAVPYEQELSTVRIFDPGSGDFNLAPPYDVTIPGK